MLKILFFITALTNYSLRLHSLRHCFEAVNVSAVIFSEDLSVGKCVTSSLVYYYVHERDFDCVYLKAFKILNKCCQIGYAYNNL